VSILSLIESHRNELFPSIFVNGDELADHLFVHAHGIVDREHVSRHTLVDLARAFHTRNVRDPRERRAVNSQRGSSMKWDRASPTAFEVIPSIDTLISLRCEFRVPEKATGSVTLIAENVPLPLIVVALTRGLAGAGVEGPALSVTFFVGGLANAFSIVGSVTVRAVEVTGIVTGASGSCVIWVVAVASTFLHLTGKEV